MTFKTRGVLRGDVPRETTTRDVSLATAPITSFRLRGSIPVAPWWGGRRFTLLREIVGRWSASELESDISRGG